MKMACYKINLTSLLLIVLYFSTVMTGSSSRNEGYIQCIEIMKFYCLPRETAILQLLPMPKTIQCVRMAIAKWVKDEPDPEKGGFAPGFMKDYYLSFDDKLDLGSISTPLEFCDAHKEDDQLYIRCLNELEEFGESKEQVIHHALYKTRSDNFRPASEEVGLKSIHFFPVYMALLQATVKVSDENVKSPDDYCDEKFPDPE